jgi:hypothetical protein
MTGRSGSSRRSAEGQQHRTRWRAHRRARAGSPWGNPVSEGVVCTNHTPATATGRLVHAHRRDHRVGRSARPRPDLVLRAPASDPATCAVRGFWGRVDNAEAPGRTVRQGELQGVPAFAVDGDVNRGGGGVEAEVVAFLAVDRRLLESSSVPTSRTPSRVAALALSLWPSNLGNL